MIITKVIDFKNSIPSVVISNEDGTHTIFLNSRLDYFTLKKAYLHELKHIFNDDFRKSNADSIESHTHNSN